MSCACELILLVSFALYLVGGMLEFRLGLLQTEELKNGDQGKMSDSVIEACDFRGCARFRHKAGPERGNPPDVSRSVFFS